MCRKTGIKYSLVLEIFIGTDKSWTDAQTDGGQIIIPHKHFFFGGDNNYYIHNLIFNYIVLYT